MSASAPAPQKGDSTALALVWAAVIACTLTAGILISSSGSGALQQTLRTLGFGRQSEIEARQQQQALTIAGLERIIQNVGREVGTLNTRVGVSEHKGAIASEQLARLDGDVISLRGEMAQARVMHQEMGRLRSTIDANDRNQQKTIATLSKRLDRLEQQMSRDLTSSVRAPAPADAKAAKKRERPAETDVIQDAMTELMILHGAPNGVEGPSGHMIDKPNIGQ
jgi:chromosome segregation ATPase